MKFRIVGEPSLDLLEAQFQGVISFLEMIGSVAAETTDIAKATAMVGRVN